MKEEPDKEGTQPGKRREEKNRFSEEKNFFIRSLSLFLSILLFTLQSVHWWHLSLFSGISHGKECMEIP